MKPWHARKFLVTCTVLATLVVTIGGWALAAGSAAAVGGAPARYIVVLHDGVNARATAREHAASQGAAVSHVYSHALRGYAATLSPQAARRLASDARVAHIELDQAVHAASQQVPTGVLRAGAVANAAIGIDGVDDLRVDVDVAVIDTGIDATHPELDVVQTTNCMYSSGGSPWTRTFSCGAGGHDDNGHGTHVAGTVAAFDDGVGVVGIAPGARLWAVKVLDRSGSGQMSGIIAGVDYVTANAASIEVANMSLGCACTSAALDAAIARSVDAGVVYVVAAGNDGADAATFSPARHPDVIAVSALADYDGAAGGLGAATCRAGVDDTLASFSNFGAVVDMAAPGVCIRSTVPGGGYDTWSGTSMASPHVAGAAALLASTSAPTGRAGVVALRTTLLAAGNVDWLDTSRDGVQEPLLGVTSAVFAPKMVAGSGTGGGAGGGDEGTTPPDTEEPIVVDDWSLTATARKVKSVRYADLAWNVAATQGTIDVLRNDVRIASGIINTGAHSEKVPSSGTFRYQVCASGSSTSCSTVVSITF
jgi:subtilisin family serine protease